MSRDHSTQMTHIAFYPFVDLINYFEFISAPSSPPRPPRPPPVRISFLPFSRGFVNFVKSVSGGRTTCANACCSADKR